MAKKFPLLYTIGGRHRVVIKNELDLERLQNGFWWHFLSEKELTQLVADARESQKLINKHRLQERREMLEVLGPDAATGRLHRERSREGAKQANLERSLKSVALSTQIADDHKKLRREHHPLREIVGILALKYKLTPSTIRRRLKKAWELKARMR
jgi:hypothetical protein